MKFYLQDHTTGLGGGQRWTRMLGRWLAHRGHQVEYGVERPQAPADVWLDMGPKGDIHLYPVQRQVYIWCHVPARLTHTWKALGRARVIASSQWSTSQVQRAWGVKSITLPLFTDYPPTNHGSSRGGILFLGRLTRIKGAFLAIETYRDSGLQCGLTIAGATWSTPPDDLTDLRQLAKVTKGVHLLENVSQDDLEGLYSSHRVFWSMAGWHKYPPEAFGLAAADAFAQGLMVLSLPLGAIPEWLPERFLVNCPEDFGKKTMDALSGDILCQTAGEVEAVSPASFLRSVEEAELGW